MRLTARTITIVRKCDGRLRRGWYRFMGAAGTKMPPQVVPISRCGTDATGWLSGSHPTVNQGAVRRRVCFLIGLDEIEGAENMIGRACGLVIFVS